MVRVAAAFSPRTSVQRRPHFECCSRMADRYFVESPIEGSEARLVGGEAHHLTHVMRAKVGHEITLFDGSGAEFAARVERIERAQIVLSVLERREVNRELSFELTLAVALPKGDRRR